MDPTTYLKELSNSLFKYQQNNFLCDVFIVTPENIEVPAHSVIMSAVSVKLKAAFEKSDNSIKKNYVFKLYVSDCDVTTIEIVLQFVYTGTICLPNDTTLDISRVLAAGQKLGLNPEKIAGCMAALLSLTDSSVYTNLPPLILTDEDICLEIVEKGAVAAANETKPPALEIIKVTSKLRERRAQLGTKVDHSYNQEKKQGGHVTVQPEPSVEATTDESTDVADTNSDVHRQIKSEFTTGEDLNADCDGALVYAGDDAGEEMDSEARDGSQDEAELEEDQECVEVLRAADNLELVEAASEEQGQGDDFENTGAEVDYDLEKLLEEGGGILDEGTGLIVRRQVKLPRKPRAVSTFGAAKRGRPSKVQAMHRVKQKVVHICDICGKSFKTYQEFADHHRVHTGEKPYTCDICGKSFARSYTVAEHRRLHTGEKPYQCDVCGKRFVTGGDMGKHRRLHTGEKPHKCKLCGKEMSTGREKADHQRMHEGGISCPICGKQFTRLHNMKEHLSGAHTGVKRFSCPICNKMFAYSGSLQYHKRIHKDEIIRCPICGKIFQRMGELNRHEKREHKTQVVKIEVYP